MRKVTCISLFLMGMAALAPAAVNYYQGDGANNLLTTAESWSLGVLSEDDTVYFSEDGWTVRNEVAATAASGSVGLSHVYFNTNIVNDFRFFSNSDSARLRVTGRIRVLNGVAGKVNLDGRWNFRDTDLNVDHYGTNTLEISWIMKETSGTPDADLNYYGDNMNKIVIQAGKAGTGKSDYTGRTVLSLVDVDLSVVADSTGGGLGLGADIRMNNAELHLVDSGTLSNDQITIAGSLSTFDVSGRTDGSYSYNGVLRGYKGNVSGNLALTGELLPGDETGGIGTLTFDDELTIDSGCDTVFELNGYSNDVYDVASGGSNGTLVVDSGSSWQFDFSGWSDDTLTNGAGFSVLDGWSSISGSSANITVVGLPEGQSLNTSQLFTTGEISVMSSEIGNIDISVESPNVIISWQGVNGLTYTLQRTPGLVPVSWSNVNEAVQGVDGTVFATNAADQAGAFYRVISN